MNFFSGIISKHLFYGITFNTKFSFYLRGYIVARLWILLVLFMFLNILFIALFKISLMYNLV